MTGEMEDSHGFDQAMKVQLQYLKDDPLYELEKPVQVTSNFADHEKRTNVRLAAGPHETIKDVRGCTEEFLLDTHGFKYVQAHTRFSDWTPQSAIAKDYLSELVDLLNCEVDGCDEIIFYDVRVRQADKSGRRVAGLSFNPFARQVHTDNTEKSVLAKIRDLTDMEADYLLAGRCRIINIWRPIKHPVYNCALAVAHGGKLREDDIIECDRIRQDTGEYWDTMGVAKYRPGFEWYYMSRQDVSDVLLFKNYDSDTHVAARQCLHTAFDVPAATIPVHSPSRESIEVRALIFTHPTDIRLTTRDRDSFLSLADSLTVGHIEQAEHTRSTTKISVWDIDEAKEVEDALMLWRRRITSY